MKVTLFSFFSAVFWSSLWIIGIYLFRKRKGFKRNFDLWALVLLYLFSIVRIFLPWELPFAIEIGVFRIYPQIYSFLTDKPFYGTQLSISYLSILVFIWLFVMGVLLLRYGFLYRKMVHSVRNYRMRCGRREYALLESVKRGMRKEREVSIFILPGIHVPFGIGVLHKSILLPHDRFTEQELYYILLHEYTHFLNHDILIKGMVSVFCCIFWWNPAVYLLKVDLEQTLEMKCDVAVTRRLDRQEKGAYLRTIVRVLKDSDTEKWVPYSATTLFRGKGTLDIKERFDAVIQAGTEHDERALPRGWLLVCACMLLASYVFLPQPAFEAPSSKDPNIVEYDSSNAYVRQARDGTYWLYVEQQEPMRISEGDAEFYEETGLNVMREGRP